VPLLDSLILADFAAFFDDFGKKDAALLWRGSRDGFSAAAFHARCDGHGNTLTVIQDTNGNIFGAFSPLPWESECKTKQDRTLSSFLFTVRNPHGVPPMKFPLMPDKSRYAIFCYAGYGPSFGFPDMTDLRVCDHCDRPAKIQGGNSYCGSFGLTYENSTGIGQSKGTNEFFAGAPFFTVKEIEVFEISS
jgi:hypothetical protein